MYMVALHRKLSVHQLTRSTSLQLRLLGHLLMNTHTRANMHTYIYRQKHTQTFTDKHTHYHHFLHYHESRKTGNVYLSQTGCSTGHHNRGITIGLWARLHFLIEYFHFHFFNYILSGWARWHFLIEYFHSTIVALLDTHTYSQSDKKGQLGSSGN